MFKFMVKRLFGEMLSSARSDDRQPHNTLQLQKLEDRLAPATFQVIEYFDDAGGDPSPVFPLDGTKNGTGTLRQAIVNANAAPGADTIIFPSSKWSDSHTIFLLDNLTSITGDVTITGTTSGNCIVDGSTTYSIFNAPAGGVNLTISGVTLQNGSAASGGAINIETGELTLENVAFTNNQATGDGGAINIAKSGNLYLRDVEIGFSTAGGDGGGIHVAQGNIYVEGITQSSTLKIHHSAATGGNGGGIALGSGLFQHETVGNEGSVLLDDCTAGLSGGGLYVGKGELTLKSADDQPVTISDCTATLGGGGVFVKGVTALVKGDGDSLTISGSSALRGGGIEVESSKAVLDGIIIQLCTATMEGGGISSQHQKSIIIENSKIIGCTATSDGGGIVHRVSGDFRLDLSKISDCDTLDETDPTHGGGGIAFLKGSLGDPAPTGADISSSLIEYCTTPYRGGGIFSDTPAASDVSFTLNGQSIIDHCETLMVSNNKLDGGGGIWSNFYSSIDRSTIQYCETANIGGGIYGMVQMDRALVANNFAAAHGGGLGIVDTATQTYAPPDGPGPITNAPILFAISRSTFTNNHAIVNGGGIYALENAKPHQTLIHESTLDNNWAGGTTAKASGGGMYLFLVSDFKGESPVVGLLDFVNNTVSTNKADDYGGGITLIALTNLNNIEFCTITANEADEGGGLFVSGSGVIEPPPLGALVKFNVEGTILSGNDNEEAHVQACASTYFQLRNSALTSYDGIAPSDDNVDYTFALSVPEDNLRLPHDKLLLGPLQNNGGPTKTHHPELLSPLIDWIVTADYPDIARDQRGELRPFDLKGLPGKTLDIGSVEVDEMPPTSVINYIVNDGAVQRSRVTKITVNFSSAVDASQFTAAGAVTLTRTLATPQGTVGTVVNISNGLIIAPQSGLVTSITLTFANTATAGVNYGSLADGRWQLAIPTAGFTSGLNDPYLRRLFGDYDNTGLVDGVDLSYFGAEFGVTLSGLPGDWENNGTVDATDFAEFGARFGWTL